MHKELNCFSFTNTVDILARDGGLSRRPDQRLLPPQNDRLRKAAGNGAFQSDDPRIAMRCPSKISQSAGPNGNVGFPSESRTSPRHGAPSRSSPGSQSSDYPPQPSPDRPARPTFSTSAGGFTSATRPGPRPRRSTTPPGARSTCRMTGASRARMTRRPSREARAGTCRRALAGTERPSASPRPTRAAGSTFNSTGSTSTAPSG
jgi:hypothetical protein